LARDNSAAEVVTVVGLVAGAAEPAADRVPEDEVEQVVRAAVPVVAEAGVAVADRLHHICQRRIQSNTRRRCMTLTRVFLVPSGRWTHICFT
jgi:hypothetical protein